MAPSRSDIIKLCEIVAKDQHLKACAKGSMIGALYAGVGALIGGLLGGPFGLAIGGSAGACVGAAKSRGQFKPVIEVIMFDMSEQQKRKLADSVLKVVTNFNAEDLVTLVALVSVNSTLQSLVIKEMGNFLTSEMSLMLTS